MPGSASAPAALREIIEAAVALPDPAERRRVLVGLDRELEDLRGRVARGLSEADLQVEGAAIGEARLADIVRGEAGLRDELVRRGLATGEQLDVLGYPTQEQVQEALDAGELATWIDGGELPEGSIFTGPHFSSDRFQALARRVTGEAE